MTHINEVMSKLENRETVGSQVLVDEAIEDLEIGLLSLRRLQPRIEEVRRRFKLLSKDHRVDGSVETIDGCKTFEEWCLRKTGKSAKVIAFLLRGGPAQKEPKEKKETNVVSFLKFTKAELGKLEVFFQAYLGSESTKEDREEILHKSFLEYLNALTTK